MTAPPEKETAAPAGTGNGGKRRLTLVADNTNGQNNAIQPDGADYAVGFAALAIVAKLSPAARRVGALLLKYHSARTGRCDPSIATLAGVLDLDRSTVKQAARELCRSAANRPALFIRRSGRGLFHTSSYTPRWRAFGEIVDDVDGRREALALRKTELETDQQKGAKSHPFGGERGGEWHPERGANGPPKGCETPPQTYFRNSTHELTNMRARSRRGAASIALEMIMEARERENESGGEDRRKVEEALSQSRLDLADLGERFDRDGDAGVAGSTA